MHHPHSTCTGTPRRWTSALSLLLILLLSFPLPHALAGAPAGDAQPAYATASHHCHGADALLPEPSTGMDQDLLLLGCCTGATCGSCLLHALPAGSHVRALTGTATRPSAVAEFHRQPPTSPSLRPPIRA